jgi:hypothetical protein
LSIFLTNRIQKYSSISRKLKEMLQGKCKQCITTDTRNTSHGTTTRITKDPMVEKEMCPNSFQAIGNKEIGRLHIHASTK